MTTKTDKPSSKTADKNQGQLIAVASGKGGVGKTWFSISLSQALAQQGKSVLLFDGDLGLANVDVQLGLVAKRDLNDVVDGNLTLERAVERCESGGFDVIAGRSGHGTLTSLSAQQLNDLVQQLRGMLGKYDVVIVDLGAGIDKTVRFMAAAADTAIVVTTEEPTSLTDAYAFIKVSHGAGHADNIGIVVNMATNEKEGEGTYNTLLKAAKNFLKISPPLFGVVRQDKRVRDAIRSQTPFLTRSPTSDTAADVTKIARHIVQKILA